MNTFRTLFGLFGLIALAVVCHASETPEQGVISLSLVELKEMLKAQFAVTDLYGKFGPPVVELKARNQGRFLYRTKEGQEVFFDSIGPHISAARFGKEEVIGILPKTYKMDLWFDFKKQKHFFVVDQARYEDVAALKTGLKELSVGAIVEWQRSCEVVTKIEEPLATKEEQSEFEAFCESIRIILVQYPAG